jgi:nitrogen-specific signal transduction histidine kinase
MANGNIIDVSRIQDLGWTYIRYVIDLAREPFLILDKNLTVLSANDSFYHLFLVSSDETENRMVYELGTGQWNNPHLKKLLEEILPKETFIKDFEIEYNFPLIGEKVMMVNARILHLQDNKIPLIIMAMEDVSKQKLLEERLKRYANELEQKVMERTNELELRIQELETMNKSMIDRELRMVELKKENEDLKKDKTP